ncbi:MAG: T9SS type A sorting domain-containing protein, partial [Prolixibacteraceae bacterium]|nr:T9SS type A sorting domain-containing protein [Prolixibacteraceae bacterium]
ENTATAVVTVEDNVTPEALAQNVTVELDDTGNGSTTAAAVDNGSNDACGIASLELSQTDFDCSHVGANEVILTVTDNNGNENTATAVVTVEDNVAPNAIAQNVTVQLDDTGNGSTTAAAVDNGSNDACGIASLELSQTDFDCSHVGTNDVVLTVTDNNGNENTATAVVTVEDNVAPIALAQNVTVQLDETGNGSTTAAAVDNGSNDACGIASLELSQTDFDCSHVGANEVTLTVTDNNGNENTATAVVTVEDNVAPNAIAQNVTVQLDDTGNGSTTAAAVDNGSNDACGIASLELSQVDFDCSHVGTNEVILTVTDNNGNENTATAVVTVEDNVAPNAIAQNVTVQLDDTGNGSTTAAAVDNGSNDACGIASLELSQVDFDCSHVGTNDVVLTVTDNNGNENTATAIVAVEDNIAPVALSKDTTLYLNSNGKAYITAEELDAGSNDNCTFDLTLDKYEFAGDDLGENMIMLMVTDASGNTTTSQSIVTVIDDTYPVVIVRDINVYLNKEGYAVTQERFVNNGSYDNSGDVSYELSKKYFECSDIGANDVTLSVTDKSGNKVSKTATVTVLDTINPVVHSREITVSLGADGSVSVSASEFDNGSYDNCRIEKYELSKNDFNADDLGENYVMFSVEDKSGNKSDTSALITVVDDSGPNIIAKDTTLYLNVYGNGYLTAEEMGRGTWDNVGIASMELSKTIFTKRYYGRNEVVLSATDLYGNYSEEIVIVNVVDTISPEVKTQNIDVWLDENGIATINKEDVIVEIIDVTGVSFTELSQYEFDCSDLGDNEIIVRSTDYYGNSGKSKAIVSIHDTIKPVITQVEDVVVELPSGICEQNIEYPDIEIVDNCSAEAELIAGLGYKGLFTVGTTQEEWIVTDVAGNTTSMLFNVTLIPANDEPDIAGVADIEVEGGIGQVEVPLSGLSYGNDCEKQELTIVAETDNNDLVEALEVNCADGEPEGILTISFVEGAAGSAYITVTVSDSEGAIVEEKFTITVTEQEKNNPPYVVNTLQDTTVTVGSEMSITLSELPGDIFDDDDGDQLSLYLKIEGEESLPQWATFVNNELMLMPASQDTGCYVAEVIATDTYGSSVSETFNICVKLKTGISNTWQKQFSAHVYPNPTAGNVFIDVDSKFENQVKVSVYNNTGKLMLKRNFEPEEDINIDLNSNAPGVYNINIRSLNAKVSKKIILN